MVSKEKEAKVPCLGVPFRAVKREQYPYTLEELDSPLWESCRGTYGNVSEYLAILTGERKAAPETFKLRRLEKIPKTNYEIAFDNLCENLWHQMSFYPATWLATDVYGSRPEEEQMQKNYENAIRQIRVMTIDFLAEHMEDIWAKEIHWRREFAIAAAAILGEKKLAFMLIMSSLEDVKLWLFNLFELLGDREGLEYLCYYFGTYTCPECGRRMPVFTGMEEYYLS